MNARLRSGAVCITALMVFACMGPMLSGHDAFASRFDIGHDALGNPLAPSRTFWLGTDLIFRDHFVRLALGARTSLFIGIVATAIATALGGLVGMLSGYYQGTLGLRVPWLSMTFFVLFAITGSYVMLGLAAFTALAALHPLAERTPFLQRASVNADSGFGVLIDVGLAFPFLLLVMAIAASFEKATMTTILATLGFTGWLSVARVIRAKTLEIRSREFVTASQALGQSTLRILAFHIFPNVRSALVAIASLSVGPMIVAESVLSYLGVGLAPPAPTWGHMLHEGQDALEGAPWLFFAPAALILLTTLGFNLLGEGLRDAQQKR